MKPVDDLYPCSFVIFGAAGHLAATKLPPGLYRLELEGRLPKVTNFIAFARREWADADWAAYMERTLHPMLGRQFTPECFARFAARFSYLRGDLQDAASFRRLIEELGIRFDEVEWAWRVVAPIQTFWARDRDFVHAYPAGTWGPEEANRLFENVDQAWRDRV